MILKVGTMGIKTIKNSNTSSPRSAIIINQNTVLNGPIHISNNNIHVGYNETIVMENEEKALMLLEIIDNIMVGGESVEKAIINTVAVVEQLFFQDSTKL